VCVGESAAMTTHVVPRHSVHNLPPMGRRCCKRTLMLPARKLMGGNHRSARLVACHMGRPARPASLRAQSSANPGAQGRHVRPALPAGRDQAGRAARHCLLKP
jgi:hypothetical protein